MFQFTTTNVLNSTTDLTTGLSLWTSQAATDDESASLNVKRVAKFVADNVEAIYKAEASEAELAKVSIDLSQIDGTTGDYYRLFIYIGLTQGSGDSRYSNDLYMKGKPLSVDFVWADDTATTVENLVNTINKCELLVYGSKLLTVAYSGTFITLEAVDEYQKLIQVNIDYLDKTAYAGMGEYTTVRSLSDLTEASSNEEVTTSAEGYFPGKESFGTFSWLLHNLRLPTEERTAAFAPNKDEAPIPGALYNQYTIHYCVDRGVLGLNAVGHSVKSKTTHVFYVNQTISDEFESALAVLGDITEV